MNRITFMDILDIDGLIPKLGYVVNQILVQWTPFVRLPDIKHHLM